jgi:hypothetical protein
MKELIDYVKKHQDFLEHNKKALNIFEGSLMVYVSKLMEKSLSGNYFNTIKDRIIPINVLTRIIEKLSKVYAYPVKRISESDQEFVDFMTKEIDLDMTMLEAEEYSHLHKGYALEPYLDGASPRVRVLPYDRFLPFGTDPKDPTKMTGMIKFMGKVTHQGAEVDLFHWWTDLEFIAFTEKGIYSPDMPLNEEGDMVITNPIGKIPFVYGSRAKSKLVPTIDSDILQLTQMIPVVLSDLGGSIMYQCFTIIYGVDVKTANLTMSPNAFWDIKSDPKSEKTPQVGTIKPEADIDKVLTYVANVFSLWLETKGVRVGSMGAMDASNLASGVSKIIDEMDTSEVRKKTMRYMRKEETQLWELLAVMNNYWIESNLEYTQARVDVDEFEVSIEYTEPQPMLSRKEKIENVKMEYEAGFMDAESAIEELYPDLEGENFKKRVLALETRGFGNGIQSNNREESEA